MPANNEGIPVDLGRLSNLVFSIAAFVVLFFFSACSTSRTIQSGVEERFKLVLEREVQSLTQNRLGTKGVVEVSFMDAFYLAAKRDERLKSVRNLYRKNLVDVRQAESTKWPRLVAEVFAELPINGSEGGSTVTGGVFFRYNFLEAAFSKDLVSIGSARAKRTLLQEQIATKEVYYGLLLQLAELDLRREEEALLSSAVEKAKRGLDRGVLLSNLNYKSLSEPQMWELDLRRLKKKHQEAIQNLATVKSALRIKLGLDLQAEPFITDVEKYFPRAEGYNDYRADVRNLLLTTLQQREDIKMAEFDLFIAEMDIVAAKRKRWPNLSLSLGLGNVILRTKADTSSVVPLFGIGLPLLDMGDIKRAIEKAEIDRDAIQERAEAIIRQASLGTQNGATRLTLSLEGMKEMGQFLLNDQKKAETLKKLEELHRADPLDKLRAEIAAGEAEIEYHRSVYAFRKAALELKETTGEPIRDEAADQRE